MTVARPPRPWASSLLLLATLVSFSLSTGRTQEQESQPHLTSNEIQLYKQARTLIDWTPEEIRSRPEFHKLQPADSQRDLPTILQEAGERVQGFISNFRETTCTEQVEAQIWGFIPGQNKHDTCVNTDSSLDSITGEGALRSGSNRCHSLFSGKFHYLLLPRLQKGTYVLDEYRTDAKGNAIDYKRQNDVFILTYGFAASPLYFHPRNQAACRFRYFGRQILNGRETEVVGFAQIPVEDSRVVAFRIGDTPAEILEQGLAWIDATSHEILRMRTGLLAPRPDLGLLEQTTQIDFSSIRLAETLSTFRLPTQVIVDTVYSGRHFRNFHKYSDYQLFRVETHVSPVPPS